MVALKKRTFCSNTAQSEQHKYRNQYVVYTTTNVSLDRYDLTTPEDKITLRKIGFGIFLYICL
jgi:hypothetical protein